MASQQYPIYLQATPLLMSILPDSAFKGTKNTCSLLLVLISFLSLSFSQTPKTVVFIGDSFTDGDGVAKSSAFASLVGDHFQEITSFNQGRSGWPTTSYLRRWKEVENSLPPSVDIFFIQLGANDLRVDGHSKQTIKSCQKNMEEISHRLTAKYPNARIVLMSSVKIENDALIASIRDAGFSEDSNKELRQIGRSYKKLAKKNSYGFLDLIPHILPNSTHDGAHLNEKGHQIIASVIIEYLKNTEGL